MHSDRSSSIYHELVDFLVRGPLLSFDVDVDVDVDIELTTRFPLKLIRIIAFSQRFKYDRIFDKFVFVASFSVASNGGEALLSISSVE